MAYLGFIASALAAYGSYESGQEAKRQAQAQAVEREFEADQLDQIASNEIGAAQRQAEGERRKSRIMQSRALALGAADGGASDPTVVDIISDLAAEGSLAAAAVMYQGQERARQAKMGAAARRFEGANSLIAGRAAERAGTIRAVGTGMTLYGKYGYRQPRETPVPGIYPYNE